MDSIKRADMGVVRSGHIAQSQAWGQRKGEDLLFCRGAIQLLPSVVDGEAVYDERDELADVALASIFRTGGVRGH